MTGKVEVGLRVFIDGSPVGYTVEEAWQIFKDLGESLGVELAGFEDDDLDEDDYYDDWII